MKSVIAGLHRLEREVLPLLQKYSGFEDVVRNSGMQAVEVMRALQWLRGKALVEVKEKLVEVVELDKNGRVYREKGLPEKRFLHAASLKPLSLSQLIKTTGLSADEANVSIGLLKRKALIGMINGRELVFEITEKGKSELKSGFSEQALLRECPLELGRLSEKQKEAVQNLSIRKSIIKKSVKRSVAAFLTKKGKRIAASSELKEKVVDRLTSEMLKSGSWKQANLRGYELRAPVPRIFFGKKQPYRRFLEEVRAKFVALGFKEMNGPVVESEFWDMDALFMPQDHSARDIHAAYYVKEPKYATDLPKELVAKVKHAHEKGVAGSKGWRYDFDVKKTARLILRTHDTSISPRTLSSKELEIPGKYFHIVRCFRYDVIDATHNADFDQIGGFVVGDGLNLRHLFGLLRMFAEEFCETDKIKVVPSYFPFTEPSAALYAKHPEIGWIELAGSGIFRPEMMKPLGVDKPVIAWGIGLGRVAMFKLGLKDIRQLYSHDLEYLRNEKVL
ncbi:phenylalanine--tRNA ligase subunit alpha [Candidatus Woesearchaeota archaeon]|nr:phenylalanine--tRNA ligase subunit alpha [Candidatus Woesearchaeota archaeon]